MTRKPGKTFKELYSNNSRIKKIIRIRKKKQDNKKDEKKQPEPKPQPSRISRQDAEEKLKSLLEKEKALQHKLRKTKGDAGNTPEKDW
jgi:hypothetical protein